MKKKTDSKKYALVVITIVFLLSALSVWCVIPEDTINSTLKVKLSNANIECVAQGHYTPKPLDNTEFVPAQDENETIILCSGQGHYKPKPLNPGGG